MKIYSKKEFALLVGVSEQTLVIWHNKEKLVADKTPSGKLIYKEKHYKKFLGEGG